MAAEDPATTSGWISFWDLAYADGSYLEHWDPPEVPEELVALYESGQFATGNDVLDLGCGAGTEALYLASKGCRVLGVDSSREALVHARLRQAKAGWLSGTIEWKRANALDPPVGSSSLDWVLDRGFLHCVDHEERHRYASSIERILRPGGSLFLRGAREGDDELGVVGIRDCELDRIFPVDRFRRSPSRRLSMISRAGALDAVMTRIVLRSGRAEETAAAAAW